MRSALLAMLVWAVAGVGSLAHARDPLRQISHHLVDLFDGADFDPPLGRGSPTECLGKSAHAPWTNPFSPLPKPIRDRHVRMTLTAAEATVEYRDAFLVEAPRTIGFTVTPLERARLEFGYRLFSCEGGKGDVTLTVRVTDSAGVWTQQVPLEYERPKRGTRQAFREVAVDLPLAPGMPARIELVLSPDREGGEGVLVALAEPAITGVDDHLVQADTNVLWIVIDSVRSDAMGPSRVFTPSATPELDRRVFARGTGFTEAYAMSNQTRTSTLAMIASVPPSIGGFHSNSWAFTSGRRETFYGMDPPLITRELMSAGFRVAHFGHNHFLWNSEVIGLDNGFPRVVDFRGIPSDAVNASDEAMRFFERRKDERWFLMLNYTAPHTPYKPPPAFAERADETEFTALPGKRLPEVKRRTKADDDGDGEGESKKDWPSRRVGFLPRNYLGELMWVDHNLEAVFAKLEALDLLDNTLVIVTADHGEVMTPAHECTSALLQLGCSFNHSVTVYDDELVVPLGIALPGRVAAGRTITTPVSHADVPPTILDVLGLGEVPGHVGRSLKAALAGGEVAPAPVYADGRFASALRVGDWKLIVHAPQDDIAPRSRMINGEAYKYELFDLVNDRLETTNLALDKKDLVQTLLADLKSLRLAMRARFERAAPAEPGVAVTSTPTGEGEARNRVMLVADKAPRRLVGTVSSIGSLRCPESPAPASATGATFTCSRIDDHNVALDLSVPANLAFVIELTSAPWDAALSFDWALDGTPLPAHRLRIGPWGIAMLPRGGQLDSGAHLSLAVADKAPLVQPNEAAVYFWRSARDGEQRTPAVAQPTSPEDATSDPNADQQLGGDVKKILKDLGYTH